MPKVDLHLHSRFSDRAAEWILRRFNFPDSYSEPEELYRLLKQRGMDFVTLTDHNHLEGALELAARHSDVFLSEQVTAYFPEDHCRVHLLVWGLNERQHTEIRSARENLYELQKYLAAENLAHGVAHPLYRTDDKFTVAHLEKLVLLFRNFEGVNGLRDALLGTIATALLQTLTPEKIDALASRHRLAPTHAEPWRKSFFGGSDDHSGIFAGGAWTEVRRARTMEDFLDALRTGDCTPHGRGGDSLMVSHGLYKAAYKFGSERFFAKRPADRPRLVEKAFSRFMEGEDPTEFSWQDKLAFLAQGVLSGKIFELAKPQNASFWKQCSDYFSQSEVKELIARETAGIVEPERRSFIIANLFTGQLAYRFFLRFVKDASVGNLMESLQHVSALVPVLLPLAPYLYAFQSQSPSRRWLRQLSTDFAGALPGPLRNEKRAWFTDTLEDVNGVATTIRKMTQSLIAGGHELVVVTSRTTIQITDIPIKNFAPVGEFELPEYELQKLSFPPILPMIEYIQREKFTELIISTPGPIGLTAWMAGKLLGLKMSGIYHTDFPQYVRILTDDSFLETLTWNYMHWFYGEMDLLYVNSEHYRHCWVERGIPPGKIKILPRGLDTDLFHPRQRSENFRTQHGFAPEETVLLYVGRVSKEKDLDLLAAAYTQLRKEKLPVRLLVVGDGPYLKEMKRLAPDGIFTGYLVGNGLATAFASADLFAFPSTTDTFGNVILEAMASGLPCVVSDQGGPRELVQPGKTGTITASLNVESFTAGLRELIVQPQRRLAMRENARRSVEHRDWSDAAAKFWAMSGE